jgi:hypothetical protein
MGDGAAAVFGYIFQILAALVHWDQKLEEVHAARLRIPVSDAELVRTLVRVESQELLLCRNRVCVH